MSPLDLCDFESAVAPAMQRVFGTVLLAANDHAASQVLARYASTHLIALSYMHICNNKVFNMMKKARVCIL